VGLRRHGVALLKFDVYALKQSSQGA
jgi:hypothetical protein